MPFLASLYKWYNPYNLQDGYHYTEHTWPYPGLSGTIRGQMIFRAFNTSGIMVVVTFSMTVPLAASTLCYFTLLSWSFKSNFCVKNSWKFLNIFVVEQIVRLQLISWNLKSCSNLKKNNQNNQGFHFIFKFQILNITYSIKSYVNNSRIIIYFMACRNRHKQFKKISINWSH